MTMSIGLRVKSAYSVASVALLVACGNDGGGGSNTGGTGGGAGMTSGGAAGNGGSAGKGGASSGGANSGGSAGANSGGSAGSNGGGSGGSSGSGGSGGSSNECAPVYPNRCEQDCIDAHETATMVTCAEPIAAFLQSLPDQEGLGDCLLACDMDPNDQTCVGPADEMHGCCQIECYGTLTGTQQLLAQAADDCYVAAVAAACE
jgi:hypothetical protein